MDLGLSNRSAGWSEVINPSDLTLNISPVFVRSLEPEWIWNIDTIRYIKGGTFVDMSDLNSQSKCCLSVYLIRKVGVNMPAHSQTPSHTCQTLNSNLIFNFILKKMIFPPSTVCWPPSCSTWCRGTSPTWPWPGSFSPWRWVLVVEVVETEWGEVEICIYS